MLFIPAKKPWHVRCKGGKVQSRFWNFTYVLSAGESDCPIFFRN
jgi:hypothetical protein